MGVRSQKHLFRKGILIIVYKNISSKVKAIEIINSYQLDINIIPEKYGIDYCLNDISYYNVLYII